MFCPSCHTPNRDNAKFCKKCGLPFVSEISDNLPESEQSGFATLAAAAPTPTESSSVSVQPTSQAPVENVVEQEETPAQSTVPARDVSTQDVAVDQKTAPPSPSSSPSEKNRGENNGGEDIALAPTMILSPEKMLAYQTRRWQQEVERDRPQAGQDVAEMPTMMMGPVGGSPFRDVAPPVTPVARSQSGPAQPDIADMPTVLI